MTTKPSSDSALAAEIDGLLSEYAAWRRRAERALDLYTDTLVAAWPGLDRGMLRSTHIDARAYSYSAENALRLVRAKL